MERLPGSPEIPECLEREYQGWNWEVAYQYGLEALTYRLSRGRGETRYLKAARVGGYPSIEDESVRMRWAGDFLPVPEVLDQGSDQNISWMVTQGLPGRDATDPAVTADPKRLVLILAAGLRSFH